jgi:hypothetical protein
MSKHHRSHARRLEELEEKPTVNYKALTVAAIFYRKAIEDSLLCWCHQSAFRPSYPSVPVDEPTDYTRVDCAE